MAGLFAKLATHPLDVAKKRYQVRAAARRRLRRGARAASRPARTPLPAATAAPCTLPCQAGPQRLAPSPLPPVRPAPTPPPPPPPPPPQVAGLQRSLKYGARVESGLALKSLSTCLAEIYRNEGVRGLWKGSMPSIIKAAPNAALTFVAYEAIVAALLAAREEGEQQRRQQQQGRR